MLFSCQRWITKKYSELWHVRAAQPAQPAQPDMSTSEHWHCIQWPFFKTTYLFLSATQSNIENMLTGSSVWAIMSEKLKAKRTCLLKLL